jgi:hypothetical protein
VRGLILLPALCFRPMRKSSSRRVASVDVFSDNTTHTAVLPPTTRHNTTGARTRPVRKDTDGAVALCATTSTPLIYAQTIE